ncbi:MAG: peroxiredoxin [Burkholderiaceae bacterium]|jgi:peroxiredoxin|nr:peroxiredoxin [Burkholderiaceae bacterium]
MSKYVHFISGLILCLMLGTVHAQLKVGQDAPAFTADAALAGKPYQFSLVDSLKKGPVVVYFYPKAFTSGCSIEANLFAEAAEEFSKYGATVVGVSGDDIATLERFSMGPCGGKFAVASDANRSIMRAYDATMFFTSSMASRISYVVTPDAKIYFVHSSLNPDQHVSSTLAAVKRWHER